MFFKLNNYCKCYLNKSFVKKFNFCSLIKKEDN